MGFHVGPAVGAVGACCVEAHLIREACRDVAAVAAVLALVLAFTTPGFPVQELHTGTAGLLGLTAFVLAHLFRSSELTWLGSTLVFAALAHLFTWVPSAPSAAAGLDAPRPRFARPSWRFFSHYSGVLMVPYLVSRCGNRPY